MTDETPEFEEIKEDSFPKVLAKSFLMSTVASAGALAGMMVIGMILKKLEDRKTIRETNEKFEDIVENYEG